MAEETPPVQTHVRKIIIGTPVRKVTGAQAQGLGDLTNISGLNDSGGIGPSYHDLIQYNFATQKFDYTNVPDGLIISGGDAKAYFLRDSAGGDF